MVDLKGIREWRIFEDTQKLASLRTDVGVRVGSEHKVKRKEGIKAEGHEDKEEEEVHITMV